MNEIEAFFKVMSEITSSTIIITKKLLERLNEMDESSVKEEDIRKIQNNLYNLQGEINELDLSLEDMRQDFLRKNKNEDVKIQINDIQKRLNRFESFKDEEKTKVDEFEDKFNNLKENHEFEMEKVKKNNESIERKINELTTSLGSYKSELYELKNNIINNISNNFKSRLDSLEDKFNSHEKEFLKYMEEMKKIDNELGGSGDIEQKLGEKIRNIISSIGRIESDVSEAKNKIKEFEELKARNNEIEVKFSEINNKIENIKKVEEEFSKGMKEGKIKEKIIEKITYLLSENNRKEAMIADLKEKINTLEDKTEFVDLKTLERLTPEMNEMEDVKERMNYLEEKQKTIDDTRKDLKKAGEEILQKIKERFENMEKEYLDLRKQVGENAEDMISKRLEKFESKINAEFSDAREEFLEISKKLESMEELTDELSKMLTDIEMKIERGRTE